MYLNITEIPVDDHDKFISISLGLSHAMNLIFGHVIQNSGIKENFIQNFASTTFLKQLRTAKEVFSENMDMYYSIQHLNHNRDQLYKDIQNGVEFVHNSVKTSSNTSFVSFSNEIRKYFSL